MNPDKTLIVKLNNKFVGVLEQDEQGKMAFLYHEKTARPLSLSLPLQSNRYYTEKECKSFFGGLLPESENTRKAVGRKYGVNPKNDFSLLKAIGYDCAGAVSFHPFTIGDEGQEDIPEYIELKGKILSDDKLAKYIEELPLKPLALGADGIRLSLAGAQDKTAIVLIDNKVALPYQDVPTTYILKPEIKDLEQSIENEFICLKTAQKIGLKTPNVEFRKVKDTKYFLIERYDRVIKDGKIKRVHQEDFCQASNVSSAFKYQSEGGVSLKDCFDILRKTNRPALDIKRFIELMVFNFLIGNNDAHGKNFSLLHYDNGIIELAPAYDILCTQVYSGLTQKMAMKIGGYYDPKDIYPRHWERLSNEVDISYTQLKKVIKRQAKELPMVVKDVISEFDNTIGEKILAVVNENCNQIQKRFDF